VPISFNLIPNNIRVPGVYVEIDNSKALRGLPLFRTRILIIGQRLSTGTVAANTLVQVNSEAQAKSFFGKGSYLANMVKTLKANNRYIETWAVGIDDNGAGVAATGTITIAGTPTENGTLTVYIAGVRVQVAVLTTHTAANIATNLGAAINEVVDLPLTASVSSAVVTLTARHKGTLGNGLDVRLNYLGAPGGEKTPTGITATIVAMASGATDPAISAAINVLPDEIFDFILCPYTDSTNLTALETELNSRWGPLRMLEGHAFTSKGDTQANLTTFGNGRNNAHVTALGFYNSPTPAYEWAAAMVAQVAYSATINPARPFQTLPLVGVLAPPSADQWTLDEANTLLYDGIATYTVDRDGTVRLQRVVTMYQLNTSGGVDPSYLDFTTMATLAYLRQSLRTRLAAKFSRYNIVDDGTRVDSGLAITTPSGIKLEVLAWFRELEYSGLVENFEQFKQELIVQRNGSDPTRVDLQLPPDIVNGLMVLAAQIQYLL
jgi:phage tail sheath gpL-like